MKGAEDFAVYRRLLSPVVGWLTFAILALVVLSLNSTRRPSIDVSPSPTGPFGENFFGLTLNHLATTPWPSVPFSSIRAWDATELWNGLNPRAGIYNWQPLDWLIDFGQRHNVEILFTFGMTPRWASSKPDAKTPYGPGLCAPPTDLDNWDKFVKAVVLRARNQIKLWEVWNEPQDPDFYCGDVATMSLLQQRAYKIIKGVNPDATVLSPSPVGKEGLRWMSEFLKTGAGDFADVMAFHGYWDTTPESIISATARYKEVFAAAGQKAKPVWDTEASWGENSLLSDGNKQAAFLAKYYLLQWSGGVDRFYWYSYDNQLFGTLWENSKGLTQAGFAYQTVHDWMTGASFVQPCIPEDGGRIYSCELRLSSGNLAKVVWRSSGKSLYNAGGDYRHYQDLLGKIHALSGVGAVQVDTSPILLEK
jgi:hypothetical protein